jgi:hypothetical protein
MGNGRWRLVAALVAFLPLVGCVHSTLVQKLDSVDDGSGLPSPGGRVRYKVSSAKFVMDDERADAAKKMLAHCGGSYDVLREWESNDGVVHGLFWSQMYVHHWLEFRCLPVDEIVRKVMVPLTEQISATAAK